MSKYKVFNKNIGERQFSLIRTYQEAEKALFYIDQSAKYSLQQAVYELGKDGGLSEVPASEVLISREEVYFPSAVRKCSKFYGYSLWREKDANC
ncbi:hypothetical protein HY636_01245, partial [Candidatus Woesearchaeota archaeon]|nr:hypothetical protein [Candidatus Woesearchaeota archaeon]